ncbi:TATA-box binding like protein [Babesia gibsoni]|uniref:TATA-box binding like protein n=1 Tax=Babesia gibsoni TaxID=33632 RepID=A0AAD8LPE9_BABGI|nr:TATA-box binding like protein [Babesia gibsoni]
MGPAEGDYSSLDFLNFIPTNEEDLEIPATYGETQLEEHEAAGKDEEKLDSTYDGDVAVSRKEEAPKNEGILKRISKCSFLLNRNDAAFNTEFPEIQNIVASVHLGRELDLREIAISTRNAEYNPRKFHALILRLQNPRCTGLVFRTGRIVVTGTKTFDDCRVAAKRIGKLIRKELGEEMLFKEFKVENVIATFNLNMPIRLERFHEEHKAFSSYEPELFAGLVYRFELREKEDAVLLIFVSGNVIITGCRSYNEIKFIYETMAPVLREFKN